MRQHENHLKEMSGGWTDEHFAALHGVRAALGAAVNFAAVGEGGCLCGHPHGGITKACRCALSMWGQDGSWEIVPFDACGRPMWLGEFGRAAKVVFREVGADGFPRIGDEHIVDLAVLMAAEGREIASCPEGERSRVDMEHFLGRRSRIRQYLDGSWQREYEVRKVVETIVGNLMGEA